MAEKQILAFGTRSVPFNRTIKDSEHFFLLAVNANFNGSGAGSDYCPTVTILSDSGDVVGRFPTTETVSAGDDAEVTFAPFLRRARTRDPFNGAGLGLYRDANVNVPAGTSVQFDWNYISGDKLLDVSSGHLNTPVVRYAGVYAITALTVTFAPVAGKVATATLDGNSNSGISAEAAQTFPLDNAGTNFAAASPTFVNYFAAGDTFDLFIRHNAAAGVIFTAVINVQRLALR